jgi:oligosaccharide repeat unit polymerase
MILLCVVVQLMLLVSAKRLLSTWAHPVLALIAIWTVILVATVTFGGDYKFSPAAWLAVTGFEVAGLAGALMAFAMNPGVKGRSACQPPIAWARAISWISLFAGIAAVVSIAQSKGFSPRSLLAVDVLLDASRTFSIARYQDDYRMPLIARAGQMIVMFGALVCGYQFAADRGSMRRFEFFLPLIPLLMIAVVLTTRASVIFGLILWVSAYLAASFGLSGRLDWRPLSPRGFVAASVIAVLVGVMFVALQFLRGGITDIGRLPEVLAHLKKWPLGGLAGFSAWFDSFSEEGPTHGYYTFTGIFDLLGIRARDTGLYLDYVDLGDGSFGNIFTIYRGLIQDFTWVGAAVLILGFGMVSSTAVSLALRGRAAGVGLLVVLYPLVLFSHVVSFYSFFGHFAAATLFLVALWISARAQGRE